MNELINEEIHDYIFKEFSDSVGNRDIEDYTLKDFEDRPRGK